MAKLSSINKNNRRIKLTKKYYAKRKKLKDIGIERELNTLKNWMYVDDTILPLHPNQTIYDLSNLYEDPRFKKNIPSIISDGKKIYHARRVAASKLTNDIVNKPLSLINNFKNKYNLNTNGINMECFLLEYSFILEQEKIPLEILYKTIEH